MGTVKELSIKYKKFLFNKVYLEVRAKKPAKCQLFLSFYIVKYLAKYILKQKTILFVIYFQMTLVIYVSIVWRS